MALLTVVEKIYFQPIVEQPVYAEGGFSRRLFDPELEDIQVYSRKSAIGEEFKPLDCGWIEPDRIGMFLLVNREGDFSTLPRIPEKEFMENTLKRVIELYVGDEPLAIIPPTESVRFIPIDFTKLKMRCRHEQAKFAIHVFPGDKGGYREVLPNLGEHQKTDRADNSAGSG